MFDFLRRKITLKLSIFTAGSRRPLSFAAPERDTAAVSAVAAAESPTTSLILHVPAEAKVWVAGRLSSGSGEVRRFSTTALAAGQALEDYEVRVVCKVDGREQEAVRRLTLTGGREVELTLDPSAKADASATASSR